MVRALTSHVAHSNPGPGATWVEFVVSSFSSVEGYYPGSLISHPSQKTLFQFSLETVDEYYKKKKNHQTMEWAHFLWLNFPYSSMLLSVVSSRSQLNWPL